MLTVDKLKRGDKFVFADGSDKVYVCGKYDRFAKMYYCFPEGDYYLGGFVCGCDFVSKVKK